MRRAAKIDANQAEIVQVFRDMDFSVLHLHQLGKGCPDILIGQYGVNALIEIKDGDKRASARKLTKDEQKFHSEWRGAIYIVESVNQAIALGGKIIREALYGTRKID